MGEPKLFRHCSLAGCLHPVDPLTETWAHPICVGHRTVLGYPTVEPMWDTLLNQLTRQPRMFSWRNSAAGPVRTI